MNYDMLRIFRNKCLIQISLYMIHGSILQTVKAPNNLVEVAELFKFFFLGHVDFLLAKIIIEYRSDVREICTYLKNRSGLLLASIYILANAL